MDTKKAVENVMRLYDAVMSKPMNDITHAFIYFESNLNSEVTDLLAAAIVVLEMIRDKNPDPKVRSDHSDTLMVALHRRLLRLGYTGIYPNQEEK